MLCRGHGLFNISNHAPRAGSDIVMLKPYIKHRHFNPRSPCGERLNLCAKGDVASKFQSTLPVRGATVEMIDSGKYGLISIHAPRAGSDENPRRIKSPQKHFNPRSPCGERPYCRVRHFQRFRISIHAPRAGSDHRLILGKERGNGFQSTLPVRGATMSTDIYELLDYAFQSTLPVRGATHVNRATDLAIKISIHAPRAGSDMSRVTTGQRK